MITASVIELHNQIFHYSRCYCCTFDSTPVGFMAIAKKVHFILKDASSAQRADSHHHSRKSLLCHFSILQEPLAQPDKLCHLYLPKQGSFLTGTRCSTTMASNACGSQPGQTRQRAIGLSSLSMTRDLK